MVQCNEIVNFLHLFDEHVLLHYFFCHIDIVILPCINRFLRIGNWFVGYVFGAFCSETGTDKLYCIIGYFS